MALVTVFPGAVILAFVRYLRDRRLKNVLRARCTLWGAAPLGHYVGYQKSTVQGNSTKACIIAPKWVQTVLQIICTTLATIVPRLHPFHLSSFFN